MQYAIEVINPQVAQAHLGKNIGNRKLRVAHVRNLAGAMSRGEWRLTHQGIAFSETGRLIDGQHRLNAVIESGKSVAMVVIRGLPDDSFKAVDLGNRRTTADVLAEDQKLVEVANLICFLMTGTSRPTPDEVIAWLPKFTETHQFIVEGKRGTARGVSSAGMRLAAVLSVHDGQDPNYVRSIYAALIGMDMESLPPIGRSLVAQIASSTFGGRGTGRATSLAALARGMVVFDQSKADMRRVLVKDSATSLAWARNILRKMEAQP